MIAMRASSKTDKTKLPVDVFESWLGAQKVPPQKRTHHDESPTDYYEKWLDERVRKKASAGASK